MIAGVASTSATERFRQRFSSLHPAHFRRLQDLWVSSIGIGTYLGDADDAADARYAEALRTAVLRGCNVIDTAINYRCQRSERAIGAALGALVANEGLGRDELVVCTKGGYVPFDGAVPADPGRHLVRTVLDAGLASYEEIAAGCHCLAPAFLDASLRSSLGNLRVQTIDVYYLHNPEQQLDDADRATFMARLEAAFQWLEGRAAEGAIRYYGLATWHGFRRQPKAKDYLSLEAMVELAQRAGGAQHRFRAIQLPYNLGMPEAASFKNQTVDGQECTILEAAGRLGVSVMISASLLQGRLARLPDALTAHIPGLASAAQRAVQFVRSTPGVATALVGMQQVRHVEEILGVAQHPPMAAEAVAGIFDRSRRT